MTLELTKPLAIIDLETTGIDIVEDRIVQIGVVRIDPPWHVQPARVRLVNPGRPIEPGATKVHGIRDDDVRDAPEFRRIAKGLLDLLEGCVTIDASEDLRACKIYDPVDVEEYAIDGEDAVAMEVEA